MRKVLLIGILLLVFGSFAGTLVFLYVKSKPEPVTFETETPVRMDIVKKVVTTGSIAPRQEVEIKSRVPGILEELLVEPGQHVEEGALIARIRLVPDVVRLSEAEAALSTARIRFADARRELDRYEKLKSVVSEAEYNQKRLELELRQQELQAAEEHLALVREGASARSGQASNLVRSTLAGMVLQLPVKEGSAVIEANAFNAGTTIAVVADMTNMVFSGWVDEADVGRLQEGMSLKVRVGALPKHVFDGTLELVAPKATENDGAIQFEVRAAVVAKDGVFLRAGYSANADIVLDRREKVLALDERALQFEDEMPFVEVEAGRQYEKRFIETGLSDGIHIEVVSGLDEAARVKVPRG